MSERIGTGDRGSVRRLLPATLILGLSTLGLALAPMSASDACCGTSGGVQPYDFNGDGYADLAVGAPGYTLGTLDSAGAVNVIYGSASGLSQLGNQMWTLDSPGIPGVAASSDLFGLTLASGNFNGDGYADLAIGAPQNTENEWLTGSVSVIYGSAQGLTATGSQFWTQDSPGIVGSEEYADQLGLSIAAGDLGNGSYDDLVIGISNDSLEPRGLPVVESAGAVQVIYGSASGLTSAGNQLFTQDSAGIQETAEPADHFASAVSVADVGGDETGDLIVGVPDENLGPTKDAGVVLVILGSPSGLTAAGNGLWSQDSPGVAGAAETDDAFGAALTAADFGGSSANELAISAPGESYAAGVIDDGIVHILAGSSAGLTATGSQLWSQDGSGVLDSAESGDYFGSALAVGNLGGDSHADLAVHAAETVLPGGTGDEGMVNVLYGSTTGLTSNGDQLWHQDIQGVPDAVESHDRFGRRMQIGLFGGTLNADLAAGGTGEAFGGMQYAGAVTVIYGAANGLNATGSQIWTQDSAGILGDAQPQALFGYLGR